MMQKNNRKPKEEEPVPDFPPAGEAEVSPTQKPGDAVKPVKRRKAKAKAKAADEYVSPSAPLGEIPHGES